jgi:hypothetical protein
MKQFDRDSITNRIINRLRGQLPWAGIADNGAEFILMNNLAEELDEIVRHDEYLTVETKWDKARNISSLITMSKLVGYEIKRKRSAIGEAIFSLDPTLSLLGTFKDEGQGENLLYELTDIVAPITQLSSVTIPLGTRLQSDSGVPYITTKQVTLAPGLNYVSAPIIQGELETYTLNGAQSREFEEIVIESEFIENADTEVSSQFFRVRVTTGASTETWTRFTDIRLAGVEDNAYDVRNSKDMQSIIIRFGNGILGKKLPFGSTVSVQFLSTLGDAGDTPNKHQIKTLNTVLNDTLGNPIGVFCNNENPVTGGADEEDKESLRINAPQFYLTQMSVTTAPGYIAAIEELPNVRKATVYGERGLDNQQREKDFIFFSSITDEGEKSDSTIEAQVIEYIGDRKSPTDSIRYIEPNFIEFTTNIQAKTRDLSTATETIREEIKEIIVNKYGAQNRDFTEPLLQSEYGALIQNVESVESHQSYAEALIQVDNTDIVSSLGTKFLDFQFPTQFGLFKDFNNGVKHLIKIEFIDLVDNVNSMTLFLTSGGMIAVPIVDKITNPQFVNDLIQNTGLHWTDEAAKFALTSFNPVDGRGTIDFNDFLSVPQIALGGRPDRDYTDPTTYKINIMAEPLSPDVYSSSNIDFFKFREEFLKIEVEYLYD